MSIDEMKEKMDANRHRMPLDQNGRPLKQAINMSPFGNDYIPSEVLNQKNAKKQSGNTGAAPPQNDFFAKMGEYVSKGMQMEGKPDMQMMVEQLTGNRNLQAYQKPVATSKAARRSGR